MKATTLLRLVISTLNKMKCNLKCSSWVTQATFQVLTHELHVISGWRVGPFPTPQKVLGGSVVLEDQGVSQPATSSCWK